MYTYANKRGGYVVTLLCLLAALQIIVTGNPDKRVLCKSSAYGLMAGCAVTTTLAAVALTGVYVAEAKRRSFRPPGDTYTATGLAVTVTTFPLLLAATICFSKYKQTRGTAFVVACILILSTVFLILLAVWETRVVSDTPDCIQQQDVDRLYKLLHSFDVFAKTSGTQYFILGNTLLGAVRHGGLMQWDDHATIGVLRDVQPSDLDKHGLRFDETRLRIHAAEYEFPFIQVLPYKIQSDGTLTSDTYPRPCVLTASLLHSPQGTLKQDYIFGPLRLPGPYRGIDILEQQHGSDVMTTFVPPEPADDRRMILHPRPKSKLVLEPQHKAPLLPSKDFLRE